MQLKEHFQINYLYGEMFDSILRSLGRILVFCGQMLLLYSVQRCQTAVQGPVPSSEVKLTHVFVDSVGMKGEILPLGAKQAHGWCRVQHYPFSTSALERSGWSTPGSASLPPGKISITHYIGGWVGLGAFGNWTSDPSARSKSLYRLRYLVPLSRHVVSLLSLVSWWI